MALCFGPSDGGGYGGREANDWFFHIPRTGGNFTIRAVTNMRRGGAKVWAAHRGHAHGAPDRVRPHLIRKCFTIVRPPLDWYRSFYRFRLTKHYVGKNMAPGHPLDKYIWAGQHQNGGRIHSFDYFVGRAQQAYPHGYVNALYGPFIRGVDAVLSTDKLNTELPALMEQWGYDKPIPLPPVKRNRTTDEQGRWDPPRKFDNWVKRGHAVEDLPVELEPNTRRLMENNEGQIIRWLTDRRVMP